MYKQLYLIIGILIGIQIPIGAEFQNPLLKNDFKYYDTVKAFHDTYGVKSEPRKMAEELICALATTSLEIDKHGIAFNIKNGVTTTRNALEKKATYGLINKTVQDVLAYGKDENAKKAFEKEYKENVRPYIGHGLDFIFRGIKYWNDPTKVQTLLAYTIDDIGPYLVKKIVVNQAQRLVRVLLEQNRYGQWVAGAYDIVCEVPLLGTEIEGLSRAMLEAMYDKGCQMMDKKLLIKKYLLPKIALYCTPQHYVHLR